MKRLVILLLVGLTLSNAARAQYNGGGERRESHGGGREMAGEAGSALTVFSESGDRFQLLVNGVKQNAQPQTRIRIEHLPQVGNELQVIFDDNRTPAITKRISFMDPVEGKAINLTLKIVRDRDGRARIVLHKLTPLEAGYRGEEGEYVMNYGHDDDHRMGDRDRNDNHHQAPPPAPPAPAAMDPQSFSDAKQAIAGSSFDDTKLSTAKTIAANNYFTTDQVIEICKIFSFDDSRLAFAKVAYKRTVDNGAYYKVNAVFSFDSNKDALNNYVSKNR